MGVPTSEVGYTPAMSKKEDHEVHKGHVVAFGGGGINLTYTSTWLILVCGHNNVCYFADLKIDNLFWKTH